MVVHGPGDSPLLLGSGIQTQKTPLRAHCLADAAHMVILPTVTVPVAVASRLEDKEYKKSPTACPASLLTVSDCWPTGPDDSDVITICDNPDPVLPRGSHRNRLRRILWRPTLRGP